MSSGIQQAMYDAVSTYVQSKNAKAFVDTLQNSINVSIPGR